MLRLPLAIRTDNGTPFASSSAFFGLSKPKNFLQQQAKFDRFIECYNQERPHQALNMKYPAEIYRISPRPYCGLPEIGSPFHDRTVTVTSCGRICLGGRKINLSHDIRLASCPAE